MKRYGLIGFPLGHSFSKKFFSEKFTREDLRDCIFENYPLADISDFPALLTKHPDLQGLSVTIPYKKSIIPFLEGLSPEARRIGAVNCIRIRAAHTLGFNTDTLGFSRSLGPLLKPRHNRALILGTGGASRAIAFTLEQWDIPYLFVSRKKKEGAIEYWELDEHILGNHLLIINTTPLGMYPELDQAPPIPYGFLGPEHLLFDLIYNPEQTLFLKWGRDQGATVKNGQDMLEYQAEAAWDLWNS